jgi:hypothetical protein
MFYSTNIAITFIVLYIVYEKFFDFGFTIDGMCQTSLY